MPDGSRQCPISSQIGPTMNRRPRGVQNGPERLRPGWLNGIKRWEVNYTGACPVSQ